MNIIHNIWGMMDRMVYFICKYYEKEEYQLVSVQEELKYVDLNYIAKLYCNIL